MIQKTIYSSDESDIIKLDKLEFKEWRILEFNEKLQELRRNKKLTQEQLFQNGSLAEDIPILIL